jgi:hypothetical protein
MVSRKGSASFTRQKILDLLEFLRSPILNGGTRKE